MAALFGDVPDAVAETARAGRLRCQFDLTRDLGYRYPADGRRRPRAVAHLRARAARALPRSSQHAARLVRASTRSSR